MFILKEKLVSYIKNLFVYGVTAVLARCPLDRGFTAHIFARNLITKLCVLKTRVGYFLTKESLPLLLAGKNKGMRTKLYSLFDMV